jgi:hypothetical protein
VLAAIDHYQDLAEAAWFNALLENTDADLDA